MPSPGQPAPYAPLPARCVECNGPLVYELRDGAVHLLCDHCDRCAICEL